MSVALKYTFKHFSQQLKKNSLIRLAKQQELQRVEGATSLLFLSVMLRSWCHIFSALKMDSLDQEMHFYAVSSQGPPVQLQMQLVTIEMSQVTSRGPKPTVLVTGKLSQSMDVQ